MLEASEIIFNLIASLAIIMVTVFIVVISLNIIKFIKAVKSLSNDIKEESAEFYKRLNKFLDNIFSLSFVSKFFEKKKKKSKKSSKKKG